MEVVESIPIGLTFKGEGVTHKTTFESWKELIALAQESIEIGSYYWTLQGHEYEHPTGADGKEIFRLLKVKGQEGKVNISIAQDGTSRTFKNEDTQELAALGLAKVRSLNFTKLIDAGILHTKMLIVDKKHFYVGSANFDWRALTQVKELGVTVTNCSCAGEDLSKAFQVYWKLGEPGATVPPIWPPEFESEFNKSNPFTGGYDGLPYDSYLSSSPPRLCPNGRTTDLDSIFDVIDNSKDFINIAVMDYFPLHLFTPQPTYWPDIDDRLRRAAIDRRVKVKILMALWPQTRKNWIYFMKSLVDLNEAYPGVDIQVKMFEVPSTEDQLKIPFARVNHNKYMVTDKSAYIGTSNWSGDYFTSTAGIGFVITPKQNTTDNIQKQVAAIFTRDWESDYAKPLSKYLEGPPPVENSTSSHTIRNLYCAILALTMAFTATAISAPLV
jgi:phospholipase D3/4